jgi:hypothetical protein
MTRTVTLKGTGQLNGIVVINKTIEFDEAQARSFVGPNRDEVILSTLSVHYPGVKINPKQIGVVVNSSKQINSKSKTSDKKSKGKAGLGGLALGAILSENKSSSDISFGHELSDILNIAFTNDIEEVRQKLDYISVHLSGYKWDIKESSIVSENNRTLDQCLKQYKVGLVRLKSLTTDIEIIKYYEKGLSQLRWRKFLTKYWTFILIFVVAVTFYFLFKFNLVK